VIRSVENTKEGCVTISRSVFNVFVPGLVALHRDIVPARLVSDDFLPLNDPTVLRNNEYRGNLCQRGNPQGWCLRGGAVSPRRSVTGLAWNAQHAFRLHDLTGTGSMTSPSCWRKSSRRRGVFTFLAVRRLPGRRAVNVGTYLSRGQGQRGTRVRKS